METELIISLEARPGQASEWLRLLPLGEVTLGDEREPLIVDQEALQAMARHFRERGLDLVIDYEHQTLSGSKAPAAGWIKDLEAREDGLWARVEWTEAARSHLEAKEYRYFSPVLRLAKALRRPVALLHAALTNTPAINHLSPLVAKNSGQGEMAGGPLQDQTMNLKISAQKEEKMEALLEHMKHRLGLEPEAGEAEVLALADQRFNAAAAFVEAAGLLGLPQDASGAQVKGAILALQSSLEQLNRGQEELAALKNQLNESRILEAVQAALKAGKILPGQKEAALKYARSDMEGFRTFVEKSLPVLPLGELTLLPDADPEEGRLTPPEMIICEALGITPEAFKAQEKQLRGDGLI